jgi:hypothetical protein
MNVEVFLTSGDVLTFKDVKSVGETGLGSDRLATRAFVVDGRYFCFDTYFVGPSTISLQNATELDGKGRPVLPAAQ